MNRITKAAQDDQALAALDRLVETHSRNYHPFANPLASDAQSALRHIRAALRDKAGDARGDAWFCGNCRTPVPAPPAAQPTKEDDKP